MATKITVDLPDEIYQRAQAFARAHDQKMEEAIPALIEDGLAAREVQGNGRKEVDGDPALEREMNAYIAMHPMLKQKYMGQHVAIYNGQLVDHDQDFETLYARIDAAYPSEFVWLATVEEEPLPTVYHRSLRLA